MPSKANTIPQFLEELTEDRKAIVTELFNTIKDNIPKGFEACMSYGMIGFVVPHSLYKEGYHCNPSLPLPFIAIASQKAHISIHHMGMYLSSPLLDWFTEEWTKYSQKKLDIGKACIRFKKAEDIPMNLIAALAKKMTVNEWIDVYETVLKKS
jgi:uncharacterized protein YdhG (YjbR/CyaY superfamily)